MKINLTLKLTEFYLNTLETIWINKFDWYLNKVNGHVHLTFHTWAVLLEGCTVGRNVSVYNTEWWILRKQAAIDSFKRTVEVFSNVTSCWNVSGYRRFESLYLFCLQGQAFFGMSSILCTVKHSVGQSGSLGMSSTVWVVKHSLGCQVFFDCQEVLVRQALFGVSNILLDCQEVLVCQALFGVSSILWTVRYSWTVRNSWSVKHCLGCQNILWTVRYSWTVRKSWSVKNCLGRQTFFGLSSILGLSWILWIVKQSLDCQEFSLKVMLSVDTAQRNRRLETSATSFWESQTSYNWRRKWSAYPWQLQN
jgi:hypothetical protein